MKSLAVFSGSSPLLSWINSLNPIRVIIFGFQLYFLLSLFHNKLQLAPLDRCVCNYFSFNNMLHCAFVIFFIESRFIEAEVILALNFVNLMVLYIRHPEMSLIAHLATISGPLSWTCVALYWNGAITTSFSLTSFIVSNTLIWGLLLYGLLFLIAYDVSPSSARHCFHQVTMRRITRLATA